MKTILTVAISLGLATTSFAQECPYSKAQKAETCSAAQECTTGPQNALVKAYQKLDATAQKEVAQAMVGMSKLCPMGKRMPDTMETLDRLYAASIAKLEGMVNGKAPEGFRKDAAEQLAMVKQLAALNGEVTASMKLITAAASECCMAEGAKKDCDSSCSEGEKAATVAKKAECSECVECPEGEKVAKQGCPVTASESLCKSWGKAGEELAAFGKCKDSLAKMAELQAVLAKNKIDPMPLVVGNLQKEAALLKAGSAKLLCPKGGLMARNAEVMQACEVTKGACEATCNYMTAASKLLGTMTTTMGAAMKGECCGEGEKSECSSEKTECCSEKSTKSECCSEKKSECSGAKTECSSTKGQCPSSRQ
ncbi:MAG: hypothetical protein KDC95_00260 [Planctomycetes bacterium]|nr:hypothetical protein [Planctomycetota bacterium]